METAPNAAKAEAEERPVPDISEKLKGRIKILRIVSIMLAFAVPIIILYSLYPSTFEITWKGRTYYLFFIWLLLMEAMLGWHETQAEETRLKSLRTLIFAIALVLPTLYVVAANFYGLNSVIVDLSAQYKVYFAPWMPVAVEYLVLAVLFASAITLGYGIHGLRNFSISALFLGAVGLIFAIDNIYPYGEFTPFQIIVPTTATLAMSVLGFLGYHTLYFGSPRGMPTYIAWDNQNNYSSAFSIAWPCSGVESLTIYTITILLFLKKSGISRTAGIIYFIIGAVVTYFINILRIVTIFTISIQRGNVELFHNYYGQLFSITWIILYPLLIIGIQTVSRRLGLSERIAVKLQAIKHIIVRPN